MLWSDANTNATGVSRVARKPTQESEAARRDWPTFLAQLDVRGAAVIDRILSAEQCESISQLYEEERCFRTKIVMQRHGFGAGEYQYFCYPLPDVVQALRSTAYAALVPLANRWMASIGSSVRYPETHEAFLTRCHAAGQGQPTPLLLRYGPGDFNCLHQDIYGEHVFPIQLAILLNEPGKDFTGGELVLTEQRPRRQSRVEVVPLRRGDGVLFAVNERPKQGSRGYYRVKMRHGVSEVRSGHRHTLGVIFHDAP